MLNSKHPTPDTVISRSDPGDDTARRYRYQWTYAAILCCMLIDDTQDLEEVFCEHHEDVLLKHKDGTFSGIQVKTRDADQPIWKTNDESVRNACVRFVQLEIQFPNQFRAFRFITNHSFYSGGNSQDINFVLQSIRSTPSLSALPPKIANFVRNIASELNCEEITVISTLLKVLCDDSQPKLDDIDVRLVRTIANTWERARDCPYESLERTAQNLVAECQRASSLAHKGILPAYLAATFDPEQSELQARLEGKKVNRARLLEILNSGLEATALLEGDTETYPEPGTGSSSLLRKKLEAGGLSIVSCNSAQDLRDRADYLAISWLRKYGRAKGLNRYGHIRSAVLRDAALAFEESKDLQNKFGSVMLRRLQILLKERRESGNQTYDCSQEHLEGFSFSLTSQCLVQWSADTPWRED